MNSKGKPVSKKELQTRVLLNDFSKHDRNLNIHISIIRQKLHGCGYSKELIMTLRNKGHNFKSNELVKSTHI